MSLPYSPRPMLSFRSVALVALFDLYESLRTRRAVALLLLYLLGALVASAAFIRGLAAIREQLGLQDAAIAESLVQSEPFLRAIGELVGEARARALVLVPPLALFYGLVALKALPLLVVLTSSDAIAAERASGAARFELFRTDRLSWVLGKLAGQTLLMVVGVLVGAAGAYALGWLQMEGFARLETAWWLLRLSARACCFGFAYLGLAFCASQIARTGSRARWLGLVSLVGLWLAGELLQAPAVVGRFELAADALRKLLPGTHELALWHPAAGVRLPALIALFAIGLGFVALGFLRFSRQDA